MHCVQVTSILLYDYIKDLLVDELGSYNYPGGYEDWAIVIGDVDEDVKAIGLECIIPFVPDRKSNWMADKVRVTDRYDILLVEHSPQDPKIQAAADKLSRAFTKSYGVYKPGNSALQSLPQYRVTLEFSDQIDSLNL